MVPPSPRKESFGRYEVYTHGIIMCGQNTQRELKIFFYLVKGSVKKVNVKAIDTV